MRVGDDTRSTADVPARPWRRLALLLALFAGLTLAGVWWAAPPPAVLRASWQQLAALAWPVHLALGLLAMSVLGAELLRFVAVARALGVRMEWRAAVDATMATVFFSWITPGAALGEPAAVYMLGRRGVPWDAALLIAFGKFATSFVFILGATSALLALGLGPPVPAWVVAPFAVATGIGALLMFALVAGAFWPDASIACIDSMARALGRIRLLDGARGRRMRAAAARQAGGAVQRLAHFRGAGAPGWLAIVASHVLYYGAFATVLVTLAAAFDTVSVAGSIPIAVIYQGFAYLAPTPGAAGVGEASADAFFGALLPGGKAFVVIVLFRTLTFYLHVLLGLVYLFLAGGLGAVLRGAGAERERRGP